MTYLELCQKLASESGTLKDGDAITTVVGNTGRKARVCRWINDAWVAIQNAHSTWLWMESEFTITTVASQRRYAYTDAVDSIDSATVSRFGHWIYNSDVEMDSGVTLYDSSIGIADQGVLLFRPWQHFFDSFMRGTQTEQKPTHFTITPQGQIALHDTPDTTDYVVTGRYQKSAQNLTSDSDIPECPPRFHDVIVDAGMIALETFDENPGRLTLLLLRRSANFAALERDMLPQMLLAEPLA